MKRQVLGSIQAEYRRYEALGRAAIDQVPDGRLSERLTPESNSLATIVWHMSGNLASRFTDFLTTDGEKPWRARESEFEKRQVSRAALLEQWDSGWRILHAALADLDDDDLSRAVSIRGQELTVSEALHRSLAHASYHVGQMTFLGKALVGVSWNYLSIPPGGSEEYNRNPTLERGPR